MIPSAPYLEHERFKGAFVIVMRDLARYRSLFHSGDWRCFHFCNFAEQVRLSADSFEVRIALSAMVVDAVRLEKIFIFYKQFDWLVPALRLPDRCVEIL